MSFHKAEDDQHDFLIQESEVTSLMKSLHFGGGGNESTKRVKTHTRIAHKPTTSIP